MHLDVTDSFVFDQDFADVPRRRLDLSVGQCVCVRYPGHYSNVFCSLRHTQQSLDHNEDSQLRPHMEPFPQLWRDTLLRRTYRRDRDNKPPTSKTSTATYKRCNSWGRPDNASSRRIGEEGHQACTCLRVDVRSSHL